MNDQLDHRYFRGLTGEYRFSLQFRLEQEGEDDYIVRSHGTYAMTRAVSTDITLDAGKYSVLMKITAVRDSQVFSPEEVVTHLAKSARNKLLQIGLSYDLAHAKAYIPDEQRKKKEFEETMERKKALKKQKRREEAEQRARKEWSKQKKIYARTKRIGLKAVEAHEKRQTKQSGGQMKGETVVHRLSRKAGEVLHTNHYAEAPVDGDNSAWTQCDADSENGFSSPDLIQGPEDGVKAAHKRESKAVKCEIPNGDTIPSINVEAETPTAATNGMKISWNRPTPPASKTAPSEVAGDDSDADSFRDFEFDSEIDMPSDDDDEGEKDNTYGQPPPREPQPDFNDADPEEDPWNAVCVVGLRVYSQDPKLSLEVVRPKDYEADDVEAALDRDDPAASATRERWED